MKGRDKVNAGNGICDSEPQPPTGANCSLTANNRSKAVPVTNVGSEIPIRTSASEPMSNQEFRRVALTTPTGTPISTASKIASKPSESETGKASAMISLQVQSRY